jgi:hypothetical protein
LPGALAVAVALALGSAAAGAAAPPDAHDRALVATLNARVAVFRDIASGSGGATNSVL